MKENELVKKLTNKHYTITTAESCTGGLLSATIINVSGASDVINCAYVTYANEAKENLVSVSHETLETKGAVSKETAAEMCKGSESRHGTFYNRHCGTGRWYKRKACWACVSGLFIA